MAEERDQSERSEEPTQKRLDEAIRRGDVVKSQEVNTWFIIGGSLAALLWPERGRLDALVDTDPAGTLGLTRALSLSTLGVVVAVLAVIAALDYLWQYRQWHERQKMSLRELKEEFKQTEGDPAIKAKIRQLRQTRARKRMMAQVPKASVVITNPTHFAVALRYERGMNAPVCLAKGADA